jgi:hypothetical protein
MSEGLSQQVVLAAVNAAGPMKSHGEWRAKVSDLIPEIAAMLSEGAPQTVAADNVISAFRFVAAIVGWELEATSKRVVVELKPDTPSTRSKHPDGHETIRTYRTDSPMGRAQLRQLEEAGRGAKILVYRAMEKMANGDEARLLAHFVVLDRSPGEPPAPTGRPASTGEAPPATTDRERDPLAKRFNDLPSKVLVRVTKRLRVEGISFPAPEPEHADRFIAIIIEEEKNG